MDESYFDLPLVASQAAVWRHQGTCPEWLAEAIDRLADQIDCLPWAEDEDRFVTELVYPH